MSRTHFLLILCCTFSIFNVCELRQKGLSKSYWEKSYLPFDQKLKNPIESRPEPINLDAPHYQVAIVGGGFAGLSAAIFFGRALISAILINAESPRNKVTDKTHNFLTRDGVKPAEFLRIGKEEIEIYSEFITYTKDFVTDVSRQPKRKAGFLIKTAANKTYSADKVIFATGMQDHLDQLHLSGVRECYGKSIYHCAFCDAFERRNKPIALFSQGPYTANLTRILYHWTNDLVVFTSSGSISHEELKHFEEKGIKIVQERAVELVHNKGYMTGVKLESGEIIPRSVGFLGSTRDGGLDIPAKLGVRKLPAENYETIEYWGKTKVPGVYIVGDLKDAFTGAITAAGQGYQVAYHISGDLIQNMFE